MLALVAALAISGFVVTLVLFLVQGWQSAASAQRPRPFGDAASSLRCKRCGLPLTTMRLELWVENDCTACFCLPCWPAARLSFAHRVAREEVRAVLRWTRESVRQAVLR